MLDWTMPAPYTSNVVQTNQSYVCVFVSMSVHLELVSDLTTESFIACLR